MNNEENVPYLNQHEVEMINNSRKGIPTVSKKQNGCLSISIAGFGVIGFIFCGCLSLVVILSMAATPSSDTKDSTHIAEVASPRDTHTLTQQVSAPSYKEMCSKMTSSTDVQRDKLAEDVADSYAVGWTGWVDDVDEKLFGGYRVMVDMDAPDELSVYDVTFDIRAEEGFKLQKDQPITFSGNINLELSILGSCQVPMSNVKFYYDKRSKYEERLAALDSSPNAIPFDTIRLDMTAMTDIQWSRYSDKLKGKKVIDWTGWVVEVKERTSGNYEVMVDMDSEDELFSVQDVTFGITEETAFILKKDQKLTFSGTIDSAMNLLGSSQLELVDVTIKTE